MIDSKIAPLVATHSRFGVRCRHRRGFTGRRYAGSPITMPSLSSDANAARTAVDLFDAPDDELLLRRCSAAADAKIPAPPTRP